MEAQPSCAALADEPGGDLGGPFVPSANRVAGFGAQIRAPPALHTRAWRAESRARPAPSSSPKCPRGDATVVATEPSSTDPRGTSPMSAANSGVVRVDTS